MKKHGFNYITPNTKKLCMSYLPRDSSCLVVKGGISKANVVFLLSLLCVKFSEVPFEELKLPTWVCVYLCLQSALFSGKTVFGIMGFIVEL